MPGAPSRSCASASPSWPCPASRRARAKSSTPTAGSSSPGNPRSASTSPGTCRGGGSACDFLAARGSTSPGSGGSPPRTASCTGRPSPPAASRAGSPGARAMKGREERKSLVGNRSATQIDDVYLYGGADTWTHYEYAQYLIHHFIDESATGGPTWTLGGQADILKDFQTTIEMEVTQTAEEILHALIPRHLGVDYVIYHTAAGFEIFVFPLTAVDMSFGGKRLPKNPRLVRVVASTSHENRMTRIVKTAEHPDERVRILGARCVVCLSLWGAG